MTTFHRVVRAHEGEVVEIHWHLADRTVYVQVITLPPKPTRDAKQAINSPSR